MNSINLTIAIVIACLTGCAATPEKAQAQRWHDADIDGNNVMTMAEFKASKLSYYMTFEVADQNEDGKITHAEYRHYNRPG